jgi:hypothetical protein
MSRKVDGAGEKTALIRQKSPGEPGLGMNLSIG